MLLPKKGGWILITDYVPTTIFVHKFALYYATPKGPVYIVGERSRGWLESNIAYDFYSLCNIFNISRERFKLIASGAVSKRDLDLTTSETRMLKSHSYTEFLRNVEFERGAAIITEFGEVTINPNEFTVASEKHLKEYMEYAKSGHAFIRYLSNNSQLKGKIKEQIFYLRSRGISFAEAISMCVGNISTRNLMYVYLHPAYLDQFTRQKPLQNYFDRLIRSYTQKDLGFSKDYRKLIKQIEGWEKFRLSPKPKLS